MKRAVQDKQEKAVVVIFVTRNGVAEVQVHAPTTGQAEGIALYGRLRPTVDRLDRLAREAK